MIPFLLILILIALIAPTILRAIAVLIGVAILYFIISISAQACEDGGEPLPLPPHYTIAELRHRADDVAKFGKDCIVADPKPPRSMPGTGGMVINTLNNGDEIAIKQTSGNWVYVTGDCEELLGWVYRPLILCGRH